MWLGNIKHSKDLKLLQQGTMVVYAETVSRRIDVQGQLEVGVEGAKAEPKAGKRRPDRETCGSGRRVERQHIRPNVTVRIP